MSKNQNSFEETPSLPSAIVKKDTNRIAPLSPARWVVAAGYSILESMKTPTQRFKDFQQKDSDDQISCRMRYGVLGAIAGIVIPLVTFLPLLPGLAAGAVFSATLMGGVFGGAACGPEAQEALSRLARTVFDLPQVLRDAKRYVQPALPAGPEVTALACVERPATKKSLMRRIAGAFNRNSTAGSSEDLARKPTAPESLMRPKQ